MTSPYNPNTQAVTLREVGEAASDYLSEISLAYPVVKKQLADGVAVHFGGNALFIPGNDHQALNDVLHRKITELACTYVAWRHAVEQVERNES